MPRHVTLTWHVPVRNRKQQSTWHNPKQLGWHVSAARPEAGLQLQNLWVLAQLSHAGTKHSLHLLAHTS